MGTLAGQEGNLVSASKDFADAVAANQNGTGSNTDVVSNALNLIGAAGDLANSANPLISHAATAANLGGSYEGMNSSNLGAMARVGGRSGPTADRRGDVDAKAGWV